MKTINICSAFVVAFMSWQLLFIFGCFHNIDAKQTTTDSTIESLFADADLGVNVKINDKGLIYCSGLTCSNNTVGCKIMQMPDTREILKQCLDKNDKILKELKEVFAKEIERQTNTTILVFLNGTNIIYNGEKTDTDAVLKTVDDVKKSVKDMLGMVFNTKKNE